MLHHLKFYFRSKSMITTNCTIHGVNVKTLCSQNLIFWLTGIVLQTSWHDGSTSLTLTEHRYYHNHTTYSILIMISSYYLTRTANNLHLSSATFTSNQVGNISISKGLASSLDNVFRLVHFNCILHTTAMRNTQRHFKVNQYRHASVVITFTVYQYLISFHNFDQ